MTTNGNIQVQGQILTNLNFGFHVFSTSEDPNLTENDFKTLRFTIVTRTIRQKGERHYQAIAIVNEAKNGPVACSGLCSDEDQALRELLNATSDTIGHLYERGLLPDPLAFAGEGKGGTWWKPKSPDQWVRGP